MANRAQRRKKSRQNKTTKNKDMGNLFNSSNLNRLVEDKMVWKAVGIFGAVILIVIVAFIWTAVTV